MFTGGCLKRATSLRLDSSRQSSTYFRLLQTELFSPRAWPSCLRRSKTRKYLKITVTDFQIWSIFSGRTELSFEEKSLLLWSRLSGALKLSVSFEADDQSLPGDGLPLNYESCTNVLHIHLIPRHHVCAQTSANNKLGNLYLLLGFFRVHCSAGPNCATQLEGLTVGEYQDIHTRKRMNTLGLIAGTISRPRCDEQSFWWHHNFHFSFLNSRAAFKKLQFELVFEPPSESS